MHLLPAPDDVIGDFSCASPSPMTECESKRMHENNAETEEMNAQSDLPFSQPLLTPRNMFIIEIPHEMKGPPWNHINKTCN